MTDQNKPVENPELVKAIYSMFENNTSIMQSKMIDEVMRAKFINPIVINKDAPETGGSEAIDFHMLENAANQKFFMAFTDWQELEKWKKNKGQQTAILTFDEYAKMVLDEKSVSEGFVINPFSENLIFNKQLIASLNEQKKAMLSGISQSTTQKDTQILIGKPEVFPQEMADAISGYLKTVSNVKAAYLRIMVKEKVPSYLIVVDSIGEPGEVVRGIADAANPYLKEMQIALFPLESDLGKTATANVEPFYKK